MVSGGYAAPHTGVDGLIGGYPSSGSRKGNYTVPSIRVVGHLHPRASEPLCNQ